MQVLPEGYHALPAESLDETQRAKLHPWIAGFVRMSPSEAGERLQERWASISQPSLRQLREVLASFEVRAIVPAHQGGFIYAVRPDADEWMVGNAFYLPAPLAKENTISKLDSLSLEKVTTLVEFLENFAGLSEDIGAAGNFIYEETPWPTLVGPPYERAENFLDWQGCLMIYHARNGGRLLVRRDGGVAWWILQESLVEQRWTTFDDFVCAFSAHRKQMGVFDPYSP